MIILEKAIWDLRHILKKTRDDANISDFHLVEMINHTRAGNILEFYRKERVIDPQWYQSFRDEQLTQVAGGDIPDFDGLATYKFGKITFPGLIKGPFIDFGVLSFGATSNWRRFFRTTWHELQLMVEVNDLSLKSMVYYIHEGDSFYVFNFFGNITANLLLGNPLDGYRYRTEYVSINGILPDEQYQVISGWIRYNGRYLPMGSTFTGMLDVPSYTGTGRVMYVNKKKKLTIRDPYPMDASMAREVILSILTKEFQIERQSLMDIINDSADTLEVLKGALTR